MTAFSDLDQSRKLAEILPLESADMFWLVLGNTPRVHVLTEPISNYSYWENYPCWSLAALLSVLPRETRLLKSATNDTYHCDYPKSNVDKWFDNPVDACYEMILKLHEQKLL